ncbi:MAG: hypothetical protein Ct9H300mP1_10730 [Planctomycetaceae bacterium]|nr:MAG: hypothetical protein Ct9H300mP1_10730 [Planctomycetaceae bacterium]
MTDEFSKTPPSRSRPTGKTAEDRDLGLDPWGHRFDGHIPISEAREKCPEESGTDGETVRVAGRIMLRNNRGKLKFYHVQDWTGRIQLMVSRGDLSEEQWELVGPWTSVT